MSQDAQIPVPEAGRLRMDKYGPRTWPRSSPALLSVGYRTLGPLFIFLENKNYDPYFI